MEFPRMWVRGAKVGFRVYADWIVEGEILHLIIDFRGLHHYWYAWGGGVTEDGLEFTDIDFFDEDDEERGCVLNFRIEGNWMMYDLYDKDVFKAILVSEDILEKIHKESKEVEVGKIEVYGRDS